MFERIAQCSSDFVPRLLVLLQLVSAIGYSEVRASAVATHRHEQCLRRSYLTCWKRNLEKHTLDRLSFEPLNILPRAQYAATSIALHSAKWAGGG